MKSLKLFIFICVCITIIGLKSVKCDEDESLFQYDGETSMSNADDANKEFYEDVSVFFPLNYKWYTVYMIVIYIYKHNAVVVFQHLWIT